MKKLLFAVTLLMFPLFVNAEEFTISCDKDKYNINDQLVCYTKVDTEFNFNKISFNYKLTDGLNLEDVRSNYTKVWSINNKNNVITTTSKDKSLKTNLQEFGILLIKAKTSGIKSIELSNITLTNDTDKTTKIFDNVTKEIKVISVNNNLKNITLNGKEIEGFDKNTTSYNLDIADEEKIELGALAEDEFTSVKGIGKLDLNKNEKTIVLPIIVTSESGSSKIYTVTLNRTTLEDNKIDKTLESLIIKNDAGSILLFNFDPKTNEYDIELNSNTKSLSLNPTLANQETSFVKGFGKQVIKLTDGDNIALIKIKDSEGNVNTYVINITKPLTNKSSNGYLKTLTVKNSDLDFNKRVKKYTIKVKKGTAVLDINAVPESNSANVQIYGNKNLTKGSVVKIVVTAENESKITYQLTIDYISFNYTGYIIIPLLIIALGYIVYKNKDKFTKKTIVLSPKKEPEPIINKEEIKPVIKKSAPKKKPVSKTPVKKTTKKSVATTAKKKPTTKKKTTAKKTSKK